MESCQRCDVCKQQPLRHQENLDLSAALAPPQNNAQEDQPQRVGHCHR